MGVVGAWAGPACTAVCLSGAVLRCKAVIAHCGRRAAPQPLSFGSDDSLGDFMGSLGLGGGASSSKGKAAAPAAALPSKPAAAAAAPGMGGRGAGAGGGAAGRLGQVARPKEDSDSLDLDDLDEFDPYKPLQASASSKQPAAPAGRGLMRSASMPTGRAGAPVGAAAALPSAQRTVAATRFTKPALAADSLSLDEDELDRLMP